jgi:hypothetical protein
MINKAQHSELLKFQLSTNIKEVQKADDTASLIRNIMGCLLRTEVQKRPSVMKMFSIAYANSNQELRRIVENPSKVKFLLRLFRNPHFETSLGILSPKWFASMYIVTWRVSADCLLPW